MRLSILIAAAALAAAGCGSNPDQISPHGPDDQKAIDAYKKMTPQQKIDLIQKGPIPEAAKEAQIKKIKAEAGIKD